MVTLIYKGYEFFTIYWALASLLLLIELTNHWGRWKSSEEKTKMKRKRKWYVFMGKMRYV